MKRFAKRLRIVFVLMLALFAVGVAGAGLYLVTQDDDDWWRILTYWVERETGKRLTITGDFKARRQQWPGLFKQLQMWSSVIDYTRVPRCDRQATQALIDSIEHAALRLDAAEHVHQ